MSDRRNTPRIGFIGFGEAASCFARGFKGEGVEGFVAYDIAWQDPALSPRMRERAAATSTRLLASPAEVAAEADIIFSAVTCAATVDVAQAIEPHLKPHHFFLDINSSSPMAKQAAEAAIAPSGARFVELAVMSNVPPHLHRVPILLAGREARVLQALLAPLGMRMEVMSEKVGEASAVKMFRSILMKGIEGLFFECILAASRYGVVDRVLDSVKETLPGLDWVERANYTMPRTVEHALRRAHEMEEVTETLKAMGLDHSMAEATAHKLHWVDQQGLKDAVLAMKKPGFAEVVAAYESGAGPRAPRDGVAD
ncbi:MAG: NAD(P)-dependent oxidoreductase [Alphaproteobacteria bacterium]|nr:NAD(P)-dependent oxidoreductase [Alphaproteobacteria bacterium]